MGATKDVEDAGGWSGSTGRNEEKKRGLSVKKGTGINRRGDYHAAALPCLVLPSGVQG